MENIIDYFINLYQQSQDLSSTRKQILQNDLRNLIAKLSLVEQAGKKINYKFPRLQQVGLENIFLAPKSLIDFKKSIDLNVDKLIKNSNDLKAYQIILTDLENSILVLI